MLGYSELTSDPVAKSWLVALPDIENWPNRNMSGYGVNQAHTRWIINMAIAIPCTKLMRIPESQQENRVTRLSIFPLLFGLLGLAVGQQPATKQDSSLCRVDSLPVSVQHGLRQDYASWKVQDVSGLSLRAHGRWESEKPLSCPGIAVGHFETGQTSYALLLVPVAKADAGYRFVAFSASPGQSDYEPTVLEKMDQAGAANYFIRATPIGKFFDQASKNRFNAHASDVILLFDSAEKEYGVDAYYWSQSRYRHDPVDY
jgi:hypothetical protein